MKVKQENDEIRKMADKELVALVSDLKKQIVLKTISAHKNELKNIREIRVAKKKLSRVKTLLQQKQLTKEQA